MTPKSWKYVDQRTQDNFSCEHENTCKSMEFPTLWKYFWSLTVHIASCAVSLEGKHGTPTGASCLLSSIKSLQTRDMVSTVREIKSQRKMIFLQDQEILTLVREFYIFSLKSEKYR